MHRYNMRRASRQRLESAFRLWHYTSIRCPAFLSSTTTPPCATARSACCAAAGYTVQSAPSGEDGLALASGDAFDVILSDMRMPGISGLDVLRKLRERRVDSVFIVMTGFGTVDTAVEAMKLGAVDFVQKPFFRDELLMRVRAASERRQLARQVDLLQRQIRAGRLPRHARRRRARRCSR